MLEVKDLYREYKPKKGEPVVALNHVSVKFPDKGLVFILGKSGSGKSTLLNVMGGLDKADGGDIIIKGKSSKNFKQGDFDSYRNTYLGFIFQEYNILDEFNVGQNIALAIELQGKKATSEEINRILEEVDLKGFGNRKPNELSGGQKQRVAIARALVKDPDIIFGDEPTGALDSKTGIQVFDTLKKLAEKKLVIVVSHDREFAELYGDRVIELADGKIISDIEKIKVAGERTSQGVTLIDQSVIKVDKDYELTDDDMAVIKKYLNEKKNQERLISLDDSVNAPFKRITRIDDFGNKESFKKTDEEAIVNKKEEFKSIKSRLSLRKCFRIGGSSLKTKPFRLVITILLAITAFGMFGLADTMGSYDKITSTTKSIMDLSGDSIALEKNYLYKYNKEDDYISSQKVYANDNDLSELKTKYGIDFKGVYRVGNNESVDFSNCFKTRDNYSVIYPSSASGLYVSNEDEVRSLGYNINGSYPINKNEIAITKIMYDSFKKNGYSNKNYGGVVDLAPADVSEDKIIGNSISIYTDGGQKYFTITGIIDTKFNMNRYQDLVAASTNTDLTSTIGNYMLQNQFQYDYKYGFHSLFFTNEETVLDYANDGVISNINVEYTIGDSNRNYSNYVGDISKTNHIVKYANGSSLDNNSVAVSAQLLRNLNQDGFNLYNLNIDPVEVEQVSWEYKSEDEYEAKLSNTTISNAGDALAYVSDDYRLKEVYEYKVEKGYTGTYNNLINYYLDKLFTSYNTQLILDSINSNIPNMSVTISSYYGNNNKFMDNASFKISAIVFDTRSMLYFNSDVVAPFSMSQGQYTFVIARGVNDESLIRKIVTDTYNDKEDNTIVFKIQNGVMPSYNSINSLIETLSQVFLYVGIGFAVFASLMLFNFITISISYKKREIGILRAVGARSKDVFNIFFAESFIIAMIAFTFAIVLTFVISMVINNSLINEYNLLITLLTPGIRQVLLVLAVSIGVAFISTFIPVYKIAMKRPIDAIRDR